MATVHNPKKLRHKAIISFDLISMLPCLPPISKFISVDIIVSYIGSRYHDAISITQNIEDVYHNVIWNPIHLVYGGTYRYLQVRTALYYTLYVLVHTFGNFSLDGTYITVRCTYQYRKNSNSTYDSVRVCTTQNWYVLFMVNDSLSLSRYMALNNNGSE
jgi:hypothetical protein